MCDIYYQIVFRSGLKPNPFVADTWNIPEDIVETIQDAGRTTRWLNQAKVFASNAKLDGALDDFVVNNAMLPIVTCNLKRLIEDVSAVSIDWLPIQVIASTGTVVDCYLLNANEYIDDAINITNSNVISRYPKSHPIPEVRGMIQAAAQIVLRREAVERFDIFRAAQFPGALFVSSCFRKHFKARHLTGAGFSQVVVA